MTIGTFKINGLNTSVEQVETLRRELRCSILVLTEAWYSPEKSLPLGWKHESVMTHQTRIDRDSGGVSIIKQGTPAHKLLFKIAEPQFQVVAIRKG